ncbi:glycosyltransferase [Burkholderia stagnalis]|uniref:glycosyltransferase n=1 Tax=Burkholderia stagnalis TaxID=1503054 RepID=UPI000759C8B3|nr:glycosyltransferase [Burkholderia stagnalis]KVC53774.1 glycosyl transferase family 1 [Burkholderia stagnalis]KVN09648.1 glycosyl transferase family 1 [Burkholderia stagnalis]KWI68089.1 glycosyl transferase family 1 [Burkholderia stagnalis]KWK68247.1 glycosyl transferase family 1 [Burkholderia stagnalis]KWN13756.1 glycosyl transferase family 1 [Burkholderia stagnalis]
MNILYTNFHGDFGGGHDTYVHDLATAMSRRHRVTVASPQGSRLSRLVAEHPAISIVDMQFKPSWTALFREVRRLRRLIDTARIDVVHVNGSADHRQVMLALPGCRNRPAVVFTKHNTYRADSFGNLFRARFATTRTIAVSDYVRVMLERESPYENITVIKHGVRVPAASRLRRDEVRRRKAACFGPAGADAIVLGSTAGTTPAKGWTDLIAALGRLPDAQRERFRVLLAGEAPSDEQRALVTQHGMASRTVFTGMLDCAHDLFSITDVSFVLSYQESLSYACREAMSMGCPTIVSRVGGLPENIEHGVDGWIVPPRAPEAVAPILSAIAAEPGVVESMSRNAWLKGRHEFCFEKFVDATMSVYESAIGRHRSHRMPATGAMQWR